MYGGDNDPTMPKRPPVAALRAIAMFRDCRVREAVDLYRDPREALRGPLGYPPQPRMPGTGEPPARGDRPDYGSAARSSRSSSPPRTT